jgi:hypothetical protein
MNLYLFFGFIIIGLIYFGGMAGQIGGMVCESAQNNNLEPLNLFFYCNLNLFIFILYFIAIISVVII